MKPLPTLMVAPNGARRNKADHPRLPMTMEETVNTAAACHAAGADGLHLHVRDEQGAHVLDAGLYREVSIELQRVVPDMQIQITTEAVGRYSPAEQRQLVRDCLPKAVSVSVAELDADHDRQANVDFYIECQQRQVAVQHILYAPADLDTLATLFDSGLDTDTVQLLFVLGRYTENQQSSPADLQPFLDKLNHHGLEADWAVCAFGKGETDCLVAACRAGGKMRVGFENSLWHADGRLAADNAERVAQVKKLIEAA